MRLMCLFFSESNFSTNENPKSATNYKRASPFLEDEIESREESYKIEKIMADKVLDQLKDIKFKCVHTEMFNDCIFDNFYHQLTQLLDIKLLQTIKKSFKPLVQEMRCKIKEINFAKVIQEASLERFRETNGVYYQDFIDEDLRNSERKLETTINEATSILTWSIPRLLKKIAFEELKDKITQETLPMSSIEEYVNSAIENLMEAAQVDILDCLVAEMKKEFLRYKEHIEHNNFGTSMADKPP